MQQRWTVPAATLVRLPADLPLDQAALVEPTAVAVHDVRPGRGRATARRSVVVGGGPVGVLIALVARAAGADVRRGGARRARRGCSPRSLGLTALDPAAGDVPALVGEWTGGAGADVAFEVSGAAGGVDTAVDVPGRARPAVPGRDPPAARARSTCTASSGAS